jgi:hypothetical protein
VCRCGVTDAVAANYYDVVAADHIHRALLLHLAHGIRGACGVPAAGPLPMAVVELPGYEGGEGGDPATHFEYDIEVNVPPVGAGAQGFSITLHASSEMQSDTLPVRLDVTRV